MSITLTPVEFVLSALESAGCRPRPEGSGYKALCPAHDDKNPSLSIGQGKTQPLVLHCFAGCTAEDILGALGLGWQDILGPDTKDYGTSAKPRSWNGNRHWASLRKDGIYKGRDRGSDPLYRFSQIEKARADGSVIWICEGESDADAAIEAGVHAVGVPDGAMTWRDWWGDLLRDLVVVVAYDDDDAGHKGSEKAVEGLTPHVAGVHRAIPTKGKDVREHLENGGTLDEIAPELDDGQHERRFQVVPMRDIRPRDTQWLLEGWLPREEVVVLIGEEGIGKGLWWTHVVADLTRQDRNVLLVATEDDYQRVVRKRLDAVGADIDRIHVIVADRETLTGHPYLPTHNDEVAAVIKEHAIDLVVIDPWISVVPGSMSLKDTQQARDAIDPVTMLARRTKSTFLLVAHPNRQSGSLRNRVGLTAVLREASRVLLVALEDPGDDTSLVVGVEKTNIARRGNAVRYRKADGGAAWMVSDPQPTERTITEWDAAFTASTDGRATDKWTGVLEAAARSGGMVTREDVENLYKDSPDSLKAADKQLSRWVKSGRLVRETRGVYGLPK